MKEYIFISEINPSDIVNRTIDEIKKYCISVDDDNISDLPQFKNIHDIKEYYKNINKELLFTIYNEYSYEKYKLSPLQNIETLNKQELAYLTETSNLDKNFVFDSELHFDGGELEQYLDPFIPDYVRFSFDSIVYDISKIEKTVILVRKEYLNKLIDIHVNKDEVISLLKERKENEDEDYLDYYFFVFEDLIKALELSPEGLYVNSYDYIFDYMFEHDEIKQLINGDV